MTEAIVNEGYSGAIIFEWMDEWVRKPGDRILYDSFEGMSVA
jgi:hypothetical protein